MTQLIHIRCGAVEVKAELFDTPTAQRIADALPLQGKAQVWGKEIYFDIPVSCEEEPEAREIVNVGSLGYWPVGQAFCLFFGPTPVSTDERPRAYSPVNVFGKIIDPVEPLFDILPGTSIKIEILE